jgi:hypothetical protein
VRRKVYILIFASILMRIKSKLSTLLNIYIYIVMHVIYSTMSAVEGRSYFIVSIKIYSICACEQIV